jgi:hypothetical protein
LVFDADISFTIDTCVGFILDTEGEMPYNPFTKRESLSPHLSTKRKIKQEEIPR